MSKVMILDLETQNHPYYGAVASPRHPENYVVMTGYAIEDTPFTGEITGNIYHSKEQAKDWLHIPDDVTLIVAHNAPYEMDWFLAQQRDVFMRFLQRGGRVFCTAYAHYLLSNQQDTYPSLDVIAPLYGGSHKVDGVKLLWEQGVLTADIDKDLLAEYLYGPEGDIANTRTVFWGQVKQLQDRGMWDMALERMEGMLFCAFAMDAGLYVDREGAYKRLEEHQRDLEALQASFREHRQNFPEECEFKESSDYHMSAWLFGGPVKYKARVPRTDAEGNTIFEKVDCLKFGDTMVRNDPELTPEQFAWAVETYGNCDRYKAGKNKGNPRPHKVVGAEPQMKWGELLFQAPGIVPLDLLPKEVREDFEDTFTGKRNLADGSPVYSTGADCLKMLAQRPEFTQEVKDVLRGLLKFALLDKDIGTYYLRQEFDDEGNVVKQSGMLQFLTERNIVHHNLNMTSTVTTRLSSNRPNFQNLPRGDENEFHVSEVKDNFVSRFGEDGHIVELDYTALEVVTLACFSQDEALMEALLKGTDMHCLRLSKKLNEPYEDVLRKCKDDTHPDHAWYSEQRTHIKPPSFAYQYGATERGLAFACGMDIDEARQFIANEKALFPGVESFYEDQVFPVVAENVTQHREQYDDGSWRLYGVGTWVSPAGTTFAFRQYPKSVWYQGQKIETMEFKPTQMRNYPIQGESGFFVQGITGRVIRWLISKNFFDGKVFAINTVHDAIYLDCHKDVLAEVCTNVKAIMEDLPRYFTEKFGYTLNLPFPVGCEYGPSMGKHGKHHFKPE